MITADSVRRLAGAAAVATVAVLAGCGGADLLSSSSRPGGLDSGLSGGFNSFSGGGGARGGQAPTPRGRGVLPRQELSFELADVKGNPFDLAENDVMASVTGPDGRSQKLPAFFDGGVVWRVRFSPEAQGRYALGAVTLNGRAVQPDKVEKRDVEAAGTPQPGFVRLDPRNKGRFALDNGNSYFPLGHNQWFEDTKEGANPSTLEARLEKMGRAGENWARIGMTRAGGMSLDWPESGKAQIGSLSLEAAKRWDAVVDAAEKSGVKLQIVLHRYGPWSTRVGPQWQSNPWNAKNGGFLSSPDEFFANPRAVALTKGKLRYIVARWGASPAVMSWELFHEAENTDSAAHKHQDEILAWHNAMTAFLHQQDPWKHLITTGSDLQTAALWQNMDFEQVHRYAADATGAGLVPGLRKLDRPAFVGEAGPRDLPNKGIAEWLHAALWSGSLSGAAGAPGFWSGTEVEKGDLYGAYRAVAEFLRQSGVTSRKGLLPAAASIETKERGALVLTPGAGWSASKQNEFALDSAAASLASMPRYLQGSAHHELFPVARLKVNFPEAGTLSMRIGQVSRSGAHVVVTVDGVTAADHEFAAGAADESVNRALEAKVPAGPHVVQIENTGTDWAAIDLIRLAPYGSALRAFGLSGKDYAALWIANTGTAESGGKLTVAGLQSGVYKASWWDTRAGKSLTEETATVTGSAPLVLTIAPVARDVALYLTRTTQKPASSKAAVASSPARKGKG